MGLFNRNNLGRINEKTYEVNGYVIGNDTHIIYHVPKITNGLYIFPKGTIRLSETAIMEMRNSRPQQIIVPGSFKKFNVQLLNFENLTQIDLEEGVEEVKCLFENKKNVDIKLPTTIKKIGANNYPIVQDLVLPYGVVEIEKKFASHDTNLISVNIPGTIKEIPSYAFNQCKNLQNVILNEGVETSMPDAFRGTNNLHTLVLPSTYNGTINLPMDARAGTNVRGNSKYDGKRFKEELNEILHIKIKRGNKKFEFNIKRGEQPVVEIRQNIIRIKCVNHPQIISIDCEKLEQGIYNIQNGTIEIQKLQSFRGQTKKRDDDLVQNSPNKAQENLQEQELIDKLDIIFQNAYRDNITKRDDFIRLSGNTKMQIKKIMRNSFFQIYKQFGTTNNDYETFDYLYNKALKEIEFEEAMQNLQAPNDFGSTRMKR